MEKHTKRDLKNDRVVVNSIVDAVDPLSGIKYRYKIVPSQTDSLILEEATAESPVGKALLGKKVGESVIIEAWTQQMELEIVSIFK